MRALLILLLSLNCCYAFTKIGTVYTTDGSQSDVQAAINDASTADTVNIPSGAFTWGAGASPLNVTKAISLVGAGTNATTVNISASGGTYGSATISASSSCTIKSFRVTQSGSANTTAFAFATLDGWRLNDIFYDSAATVGYFVYAQTYGLIDHCTINAGGGTDELIFTRGATDSWQTANSMGTTNAVYVEDCTFNNGGYVSDFNSNARGAVRFCTINGTMKVDSHGKASNTPARGVRQTEVYCNHWTGPGTFWTAIELRGGTGMMFSNICDNQTGPGGAPYNLPNEYGSTALWPNFGNLYQTPTYYPVGDQIGVGIDPKASGSEPMYIWLNSRAGVAWPLTFVGIPAAAIQQYTNETHNTSSTFTMQDIIASDRDYFITISPFTGASGVGSGTKATMTAITPSLAKVGFWVTDEGEWNTNHTGFDGQLYSWSGSAWTLTYTPLVYPHPLIAAQGAIIGVSTTTINFGVLLTNTTVNTTFYVTNSGTATLTGDATVSSPFNIQSGGNYSLAPNSSQIVTVQYAPTSAGSHSQNVTCTGGSGATVAVSGSATNLPVLVLRSFRSGQTTTAGTTIQQ